MPEGFALELLEYKRFVETHTLDGDQRCGITTGLKQIGTVDADHFEARSSDAAGVERYPNVKQRSM